MILTPTPVVLTAISVLTALMKLAISSSSNVCCLLCSAGTLLRTTFLPLRREKGSEKDKEYPSYGDRFRVLRSHVAGAFCLALNEETVMSRPFRLSPPHSSSTSASPDIEIAQYYPAESVCTENIDAWVKLIPPSSPSTGPSSEPSSDPSSVPATRSSTEGHTSHATQRPDITDRIEATDAIDADNTDEGSSDRRESTDSAEAVLS